MRDGMPPDAFGNPSDAKEPPSMNRKVPLSMNRQALVAVLVTSLLFLHCVNGGLADANERLSNPSLLPVPKIKLPALPDDGSGIYRLNLDQAFGKAPLTVVLEVQQEKVIQAVGFPVRTANAWCPADGSQLKFESGRLTGTITIECPPAFIPNGPYSRTIKGKPNPDYVPYDLKPLVTGEITLDVKCEGASGEGRFEAKWQRSTPKASPYSYKTTFNDEGTVSVLRQTMPASPDRYEIDLFLASALANSPLVAHLNKENPSIWLRLAMAKDRVAGASGFVNLTREPSEIRWIGNSISYRDSKLSGEMQGALDLNDSASFKLTLEGKTIGRRLFGTVRFQDSETDMTTQWIGHLHDSAAWRLPLGLPTETWQWQHDGSPDKALAEQAIRESQQPVMPGEPGKAGFWTWRSLVRLGHVSVIYPPSFDLQETDGAAAYRFVVSARKDTKTKPVQFEADKPWRPLAPSWNELPPGDYTLKVIAVDSQGKEMPGPMRMGILDKDTAKPSSQEIQAIQFTKRPAYAGPYAAAPRSWKEASLLLSRWHRQPMGAPVRHGSSISTTGNAYTTGGDHGYGTALANHIWANLANRALTNDVSERQISESMLAFFLEDLELHHRIAQPTGYIYDYQADTPLAHWPGEAILDAWLQTGEPRWKDAAMRLGEALVVLQNESGGFCNPRSLKGDKRFGPQGFFTWRVGNMEFGAAELLYLLGRIRRDLKTDAFVEAETKAYNWVMKHGVRERFWPINVCHSMSGGYPIWQHSVTALYFSRYLLECAPVGRAASLPLESSRAASLPLESSRAANLPLESSQAGSLRHERIKLAEEVACWAEDTGIDWHRVAEGPQSGQITPHVNRIERYNNEPMASNMLAAIVFEELGQATKNPLWSAKAEALATAVLQAQHPQTGHSNTGLEPKVAEHDSRQFNDAKFRHWDFSRGWTAQMLREYAALKSE